MNNNEFASDFSRFPSGSTGIFSSGNFEEENKPEVFVVGDPPSLEIIRLNSIIANIATNRKEILDNIFPYKYVGGGYYRKKYKETFDGKKILRNGEQTEFVKIDFKKGEVAPVLHGEQVADFIVKNLWGGKIEGKLLFAK